MWDLFATLKQSKLNVNFFPVDMPELWDLAILGGVLNCISCHVFCCKSAVVIRNNNYFFFFECLAISIIIVYIRLSKTLILFKAMLLKGILKTRGLKQKWLAEKLGVSEVAVSNWCSGKSMPSQKNLSKLSELLNVPIKSIIN